MRLQLGVPAPYNTPYSEPLHLTPCPGRPEQGCGDKLVTGDVQTSMQTIYANTRCKSHVFATEDDAMQKF